MDLKDKAKELAANAKDAAIKALKAKLGAAWEDLKAETKAELIAVFTHEERGNGNRGTHTTNRPTGKHPDD